VGTPTWARGLASAIWQGIDRRLSGIHHWTDAGVASWYDLAVAIQEEALPLGLLTTRIPIAPLTTEEYPLPAVRPPYSVLDKSSLWAALSISPTHWRVALRQMLQELKEEE
jgi:dTDP-4-dehydrorhamnose reductase